MRSLTRRLVTPRPARNAASPQSRSPLDYLRTRARGPPDQGEAHEVDRRPSHSCSSRLIERHRRSSEPRMTSRRRPERASGTRTQRLTGSAPEGRGGVPEKAIRKRLHAYQLRQRTGTADSLVLSRVRVECPSLPLRPGNHDRHIHAARSVGPGGGLHQGVECRVLAREQRPGGGAPSGWEGER
jgi:hypothetical protein